MTFIESDNWKPSKGIKLDETAFDIVKSNTSSAILAGPGAGKTELLAQRATYLLSTGKCTPPKRILAIAFKVDATQNLKTRVASRCDKLHAQRFDSHTLDAFAKSIVDQYIEALPLGLRPSFDYKIIFPGKSNWIEFQKKNEMEIPQIQKLKWQEIADMIENNIPNNFMENSDDFCHKIHKSWWEQQLGCKPSHLTFNMIKYLAKHIFNTQPIILNALRQTYSYVFLDEFQDVTNLQYDLIKSAFLGSSTVLTAVGDTNQAIMGWAGAKKKIFDHFINDFGATFVPMQNNFRSNSRIVKLINDLASTFDPKYLPTKCFREDETAPNDAVEFWVFNTRHSEANYIAKFITEKLSNDDNLSQSDFLILSKAYVNKVEDRILVPFKEKKLKIRNEARLIENVALQDLVNDKVYNFFLATVKLALNEREGTPFQVSCNFIAEVRGLDLQSEKGHSKTLQYLRQLVYDLSKILENKTPSEVTGKILMDILLDNVTQLEISRIYPAGPSRLTEVINSSLAFFDECRREISSWSDVINSMEGKDAVHLMTIHKSKGLEYNTVIFVEFNDDTFWGSEEDINVFFVALSRAKECVYFTYTRDSKGLKYVTELGKKLRLSGVTIFDRDKNTIIEKKN